MSRELAYRHLSRTIASLAICLAGAVAMYTTNGQTGIGWSVLGLLIIWGF
jgi:hypothetical protein